MLGTSAIFPWQTMAGGTCNGVALDRNTEAVTVSDTVRPGLVQALLLNTLLVWARL